MAKSRDPLIGRDSRITYFCHWLRKFWHIPHPKGIPFYKSGIIYGWRKNSKIQVRNIYFCYLFFTMILDFRIIFFSSHFTIFLILFQFLDAISSLNYLSEIFVIFDEDYSMSQVENSSNMTFKKIRGEIEEKSLFTNQSFCTNNLHFF